MVLKQGFFPYIFLELPLHCVIVILMHSAASPPINAKLSRHTSEGDIYRMCLFYLHGPSQCKIETLFMEILTKRPSTEHSLLNSSLNVFTSIQRIQNTVFW